MNNIKVSKKTAYESHRWGLTGTYKRKCIPLITTWGNELKINKQIYNF